MSSQWGLVQRLIGTHHTQRSLDRLDQSTAALNRRIQKDLRSTRAAFHSVLSQLTALTADPSPGGSLAEGQQAFRELLQQSKQMGTIHVSLREESALVSRPAGDLEGWTATVGRERWQILQNLAVGLIGVVVAMAAILAGGTLWRVAAVRYTKSLTRTPSMS
jgi:hypothetical protein